MSRPAAPIEAKIAALAALAGRYTARGNYVEAVRVPCKTLFTRLNHIRAVLETAHQPDPIQIADNLLELVPVARHLCRRNWLPQIKRRGKEIIRGIENTAGEVLAQGLVAGSITIAPEARS